MADNKLLPATGTGTADITVATDEIAGIDYQVIKLADGTLGSTALIPGDATNGLDVDVTRLPALPAGSNNIGDVDVLSLPALPAGSNNIGDVDVLSSALPTGASTLAEQQSQTTHLATIAGDTTAIEVDADAIRVATELIDDTVTTLGTTTYTEATSKGITIGAVRRDADTTLVGTTNEFGPLQMDANGRLKVEIFDGGDSHTVDGTVAVSGTVAVTQSGTWDEVGINDSGNSITVDAPTGTPVNVQIGDGTRQASVRDTGSSDSLNVAIVDGSGNQITTFGGGTQYTEDAAAAADPVGNALILVRDDSPSTVTGTDGDNVAQRGTNYGAAYVQVVTSAGSFVDAFGGSGGTAQADESAFTEGSTNMTPVGGVYNETITSDPTEDQAAAIRITAKRAAHANLRDASGVEIGTATTPLVVGGNIANDSTDAGNPVKIGGKAETGTPTSVADGDRVDAWFDERGALVGTITGGANNDQVATIPGTSSDLGDAQTGGVALTVFATNRLYNGASGWDRWPGTAADGGLVNLGANNDVTVAGVATAANQTTELASLAAIESDADAIRIATQLIDDPVQVLGTDTYTEATSKGMTIGAVRRDADTTLVGTTNEFGPLQMDANGRLKVEAFSGETLPVSLATLPALVAGSANIGDVDIASAPTGASSITIQGAADHAAARVGNPVMMGGRASAAIPTDVGADNDVAAMWTNRNGAQMVSTAPHIGLNSDPWNLVHEAAQYTTTQTSTVLVAGGASEKIVVTQIQIQSFDTVAGDVIVYFGTGAYSRGTNRAIFDGTFKPSATSAPGFASQGPFISGANGDDILVTTTNNTDVTISVWYYVVT